MESFNGVVRDREKITRSIKRRDSPVIDGMRIRHNTKSRMGRGQVAVRQTGMIIGGTTSG